MSEQYIERSRFRGFINVVGGTLGILALAAGAARLAGDFNDSAAHALNNTANAIMPSAEVCANNSHGFIDKTRRFGAVFFAVTDACVLANNQNSQVVPPAGPNCINTTDNDGNAVQVCPEPAKPTTSPTN